MGKKANVLDIMDTGEIFSEYLDKFLNKNMNDMGELMLLNIKNKILEDRVNRLEDEIYELKDRLEGIKYSEEEYEEVEVSK